MNYTEGEEKEAMDNLLKAHHCYGKRAISLDQCFRRKYIPQVLKDRYVKIMAEKYPDSNFDWLHNPPMLKTILDDGLNRIPNPSYNI